MSQRPFWRTTGYAYGLPVLTTARKIEPVPGKLTGLQIFIWSYPE